MLLLRTTLIFLMKCFERSLSACTTCIGVHVCTVQDGEVQAVLGTRYKRCGCGAVRDCSERQLQEQWDWFSHACLLPGGMSEWVWL